MAEFASRHAARAATWGRIICLTSGGAEGFPEEVSYGAAKAALESYTKSAAWELGHLGITANLIHPPATDNPAASKPQRGSRAHHTVDSRTYAVDAMRSNARKSSARATYGVGSIGVVRSYVNALFDVES